MSDMLREILSEARTLNVWTEEDRECECGWSGLVEILTATDGWFWDCPECADEHSEPVPVDSNQNL
jgi:hypothetical protein